MERSQGNAAEPPSTEGGESLRAHLRLSSRQEFLEPIHNLSERLFSAAGIEEDQMYWLVLAVREAVINAVLHGNEERPEREIQIEYLIGPERVRICVTDEGEGFDPETVPDPVANENLLSQDGRGIFLMRQLMDEVSFDFRDEGGTRLCMTKGLDAPPEPGSNDGDG